MQFQCRACWKDHRTQQGLRSHLLQRPQCADIIAEAERLRDQGNIFAFRRTANSANWDPTEGGQSLSYPSFAEGGFAVDDYVDNESFYSTNEYNEDASVASREDDFEEEYGNANLDMEYNYHGDYFEEPLGSSSDDDDNSLEDVSEDEMVMTMNRIAIDDERLRNEEVKDEEFLDPNQYIADDSFRPGTVFTSSSLDCGEHEHEVELPFLESLSLLRTLRNERVALNTYDKIREWHSWCPSSSSNLLSRKDLLSKIYSNFPDLPKHKVVDVSMDTGRPGHARVQKFPVITVDVWSQIFMKLNDPILMCPENCVVDPDDPYGRYNPKKFLDEIQDGRVFNDTCTRLRLQDDWNDESDFVVGLIEYCDKTFTDVLGRYNLEPVVMTFSFLTRKARANPKSWIICGFITQTGFTKAQQGSLSKGTPSAFFHEQMRVIHKPFHDHKSRVWTQMRLCNVKELRRVYFPLLCICGDGPGQDTMCGRYVSYGGKTGRVAWKCLCKSKDHSLFFGEEIPDDDLLSDSLCRWVDARVIRDLVILSKSNDKEVRKEALDDLQKLSTHETQLFTHGTNMLLAATEEEGIYSLCYTCVLHCIYQGLVPRTVETVLARITQWTKEAVDSWARISLFQRNIQTGMQKMFHRTTFKSMCELSKMSGKEKMGHLFCWMVLVRSGIGATIFTRSRYGRLTIQNMFDHLNEDTVLYFLKENALQTFSRIFEMVLTFDRYIMVPGPHLWDANGPEEEVQAAENKLYRRVSSMMRTIMWVLPSPQDLPEDENGNKRSGTKKKKNKKSNKKKRVGKKGGVETVEDIMEEERQRFAGPGRHHPMQDNDDLSDTSNNNELRGDVNPVAESENNNRKTWLFQKIHLITHIMREMTRIGVMANVDTSSGESNHKFWAKLPAHVSSKKGIRIFALSVVTRVVEYLAIEHAYTKMCPETPPVLQETTIDLDQGKKFFLRKNILDSTNISSKKYKVVTYINRKEKKYEHVSNITDYINRKWAHIVRGDAGGIKCSTELRIQTTEGPRILRCNPDYQGMSTFDFVWVKYEALIETLHGEHPNWPLVHPLNDCYPCQLACVVLRLGSHNCKHIVVRPCVDYVSDKNDDTTSSLVRRWRKTYGSGLNAAKDKPVFVTVSTADIQGQVYCFEDFPTQFQDYSFFEKERKDFMKRYLLSEYCRREWQLGIEYIRHDWVYSVVDKNEWPSHFIRLTRNPRNADNDDEIYQPPDPPTSRNISADDLKRANGDRRKTAPQTS